MCTRHEQKQYVYGTVSVLDYFKFRNQETKELVNIFTVEHFIIDYNRKNNNYQKYISGFSVVSQRSRSLFAVISELTIPKNEMTMTNVL